MSRLWTLVSCTSDGHSLAKLLNLLLHFWGCRENIFNFDKILRFLLPKLKGLNLLRWTWVQLQTFCVFSTTGRSSKQQMRAEPLWWQPAFTLTKHNLLLDTSCQSVSARRPTPCFLFCHSLRSPSSPSPLPALCVCLSESVSCVRDYRMSSANNRHPSCRERSCRINTSKTHTARTKMSAIKIKLISPTMSEKLPVLEVYYDWHKDEIQPGTYKSPDSTQYMPCKLQYLTFEISGNTLKDFYKYHKPTR